MGRRNKNKSKQPKSQVIFNEDDRAKYLLGFRKRKQERKQKAKEEIEEQIKQDRKRQRELKVQSLMDERKKAGLPMLDEVKITNQDVIETNENTIIISDFSNKNEPVMSSDEEELGQSELKDVEITKSKAKLSKETALITERLTKLEKKLKTIEKPNSKNKRVKQLKAKNGTKSSKSSKKFQINNEKIKLRESIKTKKKLAKKLRRGK